MNVAGIGMRNVWRNKVRTLLTVAGVSIAVVAFLLLRTVLSAWTAAADQAAKDRIATRHKVTFVLSLPKKYVQEIREVPGVQEVSWANWFGGRNPNDEDAFFATIAVDPKSFLSVFDEVQIPAEQKERWLQNRRGALIGDVLAKQYNWKVGDKVTLAGTIYPGDWEFIIEGIYTASRRTIDRSTFWFHWDYLNESTRDRFRDQVGWISARVDDPGQAAAVARRIDQHFSNRDVQTLSMSERAMNTSFLGMLSAILKAVDFVSIVILVIMMLILGNTIAMGVRERTHEYGVLRAIGFLPSHLAIFVLGEAVLIGILGSALGVALAYPFVNHAVGRFLEENVGNFFPYFRLELKDTTVAALLAVLLAFAAAAIPAYRASKLDVIDSLRRVG